MEIKTFIKNYQEAFGEAANLPIVFWYSDTSVSDTEKINGCFFKSLETILKGNPVSLNEEVIGCGGGKFYTGFTEMPERVPNFVSLKEKYKKTPEMVLEFINKLGVLRAENKFLNLARLDKVDNFEEIEGILFFVTPDVLSGLATWAYFDNNSEDAVTSIFGSGCSATITQTVIENRKNGRRTFIGFFDPSVRPHVEPNILSFAIPMSRFKEMYYTMQECSLFDTHAWNKIHNRLSDSN